MKDKIEEILIEDGEGLLDDVGVDAVVAGYIAGRVLDVIRPRLCIKILRASKRSQDDDWNEGCCGNERERQLETDRERYPSVLEAFRDIVGDDRITPEQITTFDPNIYCDTRDGKTRTVEDNTASGNFRCVYDRMENKQGRNPTKKEMAEFEAGRIKLRLADYEIIFNVMLVGVEEVPLSELLSVNNW